MMPKAILELEMPESCKQCKLGHYDELYDITQGGINLIEKIYRNKYMATCDNCGTGQEYDSWADVIDFMNEEGWKKRLVDGEFKHYCPECQKMINTNDKFQVDYLPEKKEIRINLPEEVWKNIDTIIMTRLFQEELVVEKQKEDE